MSIEKTERCCQCDAETGNAGIYDGSLYLESGIGPLCDDCYDKSPEIELATFKEKLAVAEAEIAHLRDAVCGQCGRSLAPDGDCHGCRADRLERTCTCTWAERDGVWVAGCCGEIWEFTTDGPVENKMRYCLFCGARMVIGDDSG